MTSAAEAWNDRYADLDSELDKPTQMGFPFKFKTNYHVRVHQAQLCTSNRGDVQIEFTLQILADDGSVKGAQKEWVQLPKQLSDADLPQDKVLKITRMRRDTIGAFLANADDNTYRAYATWEADGDKIKLLKENGTQLKGEELTLKQTEVNRHILTYCDDLHTRVNEGGTLSDFDGVELYLIKTENPKNERYPYTNFRAYPDPKLAVFDGDV